ncbi:hypothetical protein HDU97_002040 [Phlyctochytrium planicorne]|nr:hypothetical protein HDU97_002040 [Phlyctochytrium planicorne]
MGPRATDAAEYPRQRAMRTAAAPARHGENVAFTDPSSKAKKDWSYPLLSISSCVKDPIFGTLPYKALPLSNLFPSTACTAFTLPCLANARIAHEFNHQPGLLEGILSTCFLGIFATAPLRGDIRQRLEIKGDSFSDYFVSCCCGPCAMIQERWELDENQGLY